MTKNELESLYKSGLSMFDISKQHNCSVNKIVYWMKKYGIPRRTYSESSYLKHNPHGDPFKIKSVRNIKESVLFGLGLGIYWGEGAKFSKHSLRVANTNPKIIRAFRQFIWQLCGLDDKRISYSIVSFNDVGAETARKYWSKELKISPERFGKITQIPKQGQGTYKSKSLYGVCTIQVHNVKLRNWLMDILNKLDY